MGSYDGKYGHMCLLWFLNSTFNGIHGISQNTKTKYQKKNIEKKQLQYKEMSRNVRQHRKKGKYWLQNIDKVSNIGFYLSI